MANTRSRQANKHRAGERMMMALRRSSAAGVLLSQAVARRVGLNSSDMECLDLILIDGPASAGEIGRRTGLTSGAGTGLSDRLQGKGLVERGAHPRDRPKVLGPPRPSNPPPLATMLDPLPPTLTH